MRVLSPELGVSPFSNSGGEVYDREMLAAYERHGATVTMILPREKPYDEKAFKEAPFRIAFKRIAPPYSFNLLILPKLARAYRNHPESVLRIHSPYFTGLGILLFRAFHREAKVIASYFHVEKFPLFRRIDAFVLPRADHIFTISESTKNAMLEAYPNLDPAKITVTYCGIDPKFSPGKKNAELAKRYDIEGKTVLLYLGGLKPRKNLPFLLDVLAKIEDPNVVILFAGSGGEREALETKARELNLSNRIRFTGYVKEEEKVDIYRTSDMFVFPTLLEGFGMVAAEAMACGKPVVASNASSLPEVVDDGQTGYLAAVNDVDAWVEAIERLAASPELRESMGKRGPAVVSSKFSWDVSAAKQIEITKALTEHTAA